MGFKYKYDGKKLRIFYDCRYCGIKQLVDVKDVKEIMEEIEKED